MTNAEYLRALRLLAKAKGMCGICRARPAKPERKSCQHCIDLHRTKARKMAAEHPALGLCVECTRPALDGMTRCEFHRQRTNARLRKRADIRKIRGLCPMCGGEGGKERQQCDRCALRTAEYQRRETQKPSPCSRCGEVGHYAPTCDLHHRAATVAACRTST